MEGREEGEDERDREEGMRDAEGREETAEEELRVAYQNVGGGIEATNILLERGREEKWDLVFAAEAWEGKKGERTTQQGYRNFYVAGGRIVLYVREEVDLHRLGRIETNQNWIKVGDLITGIYLSPRINTETLRKLLSEIPTTDNIIGDANCTLRYKRRILLEKMTARALAEKPLKGNTWKRWHQPQQKWVESKPDVIFSMGNWITKGTEWTTSDHLIIYGVLPSLIKKRRLLVTDWDKWTSFAEDEDKEANYLDPIMELKIRAKGNLKDKKYSPKPWWDSEIKEQRKVARQTGRTGAQGEWRREAAKLRNLIKRKKREHWSSFVEETVSGKAQDIWKVIRVARNPFNTRNTMPATLNNKETDELKAQEIISQHFQGTKEEQVDTELLSSLKGLQKDKADIVSKLWKALSSTNNTSTPGPDRISYRLLKLLKGTNLGTQTIALLADFLRGKRNILFGEGDGREITVVMIPKTGKNLTKAKGWRPIVLINCLLKLTDKVVANELQDLPVFHHGQHGSRKGKNAIDMVIQATTEAQLEITRGKKHAWALGDIKSAFNYTQKRNLLDRLGRLEKSQAEGLIRYIHWFFQPRQADLTWDGEIRKSMEIRSGVPQGSPLSPVLFLIGVAKALESADMRIQEEITSHKIRIYSYVDDFNCTTEQLLRTRPGRQQEAITAAKKARTVVSQELEKHGWTRDPDKDEEINFGVQGKAKWVGIHFTHDLNWKTHCSKRLDQAEAAWACISTLGTTRGGLSPTAWRQVYTSSIRAIATYGWELVNTEGNTNAQVVERLRRLQYQGTRKVTGGYHGARQELLENISKVEPVQTKLWDMKVRAAARILEKASDLINRVRDTRETVGGRSWQDHSLTWAAVKGKHYNTCLEGILAAMGENGERQIMWNFSRERKQVNNLRIRDLGNKDTPQVVWEMRVRDLEEEGWTTAFTDGSGLKNKAAGGFCSNPNRTDKERQPEITGSGYLGTKATHFDGELEGIALALEKYTEADTHLLAIMTDSKPAIRTVEKLDSGIKPPRSAIEARILETLETRENNLLETHIAWVKGHKDIKGNEKADKLSKETSILGHESEGVVTPAGLKAWARRVRAEARGGSGEGILGWHRRAISAYTWCVTEKGPQRKWLHYIKKADTSECECHQQQTGEHLVEECSLLADVRKPVEKEDMCTWKTRHIHKIEKKKKGPVEPKKEEEVDELERFFCHVYEFHIPVLTPAVVPAVLPPRYAIRFVPASVSAVPASASPTVFTSPIAVPSPVSTDYSVIPSVNFATVPSPVSTGYSVISSVNFVVSSACIEPTT